MRIRRIFLILSTILMLNFVGCGGNSSEEAKALLTRILTLVGIPQEIVVNICQDGNDNGVCDMGELQTKITINRGDTLKTIFEKVKFNENGQYFLQNYDPTKKILMEIEDNAKLNNTGQKVILSYQPLTQELSILQSLVDNNLLQEEEIKAIRISSVREALDRVLLENIFENQTILEEHNMTSKDATIRNLEYIAEGLRDINISSGLVQQLESCEENSTCQQLILTDANEQTEITEKEAKIIAETNSTEGTGDEDTSLTHETNNNSEDSNTTNSENNSTEDIPTDDNDDNNNNKTEKNVADGYIIKLSSSAVATCGSDTYNSSLTIGAKGRITFENIILDDNCTITIPSGSTIDSNNNGKLDGDDKILNFEMKAPADASFISPLTTLLLEKKARGEDVSLFKTIVKDFNPVTSINSNKDKKILLLMEVLKELLRANKDISQVNIPINLISNENKSVSDINVSNMTSNFSSSINSIITEKVNIKKSILELFTHIDQSKIDLSSFFVNISDGGENIEEAIKNSKKKSISSDIFRGIIRDSSDKDSLSTILISINSKLNEDKTNLQKAIRIFDNLVADDDIEYKIERAKTLLELANSKEKDAKVGLALFELAEITNSSEVSSLLDISLTEGGLSENLLNFIKGNLNDNLNVKIRDDISDGTTLTKNVAINITNKLQNIENTLKLIFSDPNYTFRYDDMNLTGEQSKLIRAGILVGVAKIEYLLAFKYFNSDDIQTKTMSYNGQDIEYNELASNPVPILNRQEVGEIDDAKRLTNSKNILLEAINIYNSFDVTSLDDEEERADFSKDQADMIKIKNSILGGDNYIGEEDEDNKLIQKNYYDFSAMFNPTTALELGSTLGHNFNYKNCDYLWFNGVGYIAGEYNSTLSQYKNDVISNYWIAEDNSSKKLEANESIGFPKVEINATNIPTGVDSKIPNSITKIEVIENNTTKYSFVGDDILRYIFNEIDTHRETTHTYTSSSDINITHKLNYNIVIPHDIPPTYNIEVTDMPNWLHSTTINDTTIVITADDNITNQFTCYEVKMEVFGKRKVEYHCINII